MSRKAIAVISGDIHYILNNLTLADASVRQAISKANELNVPFIANGDVNDTKANLRGECVNAMIETFKTAKIKPYVNIGNHDKISAKGTEHSLNFLAPYAHIIDKPTFIDDLTLHIIPYFDDIVALRQVLSTIPVGSTLIMHQGLTTGLPGEYIRDHSALETEDLKDFRTILSHYHARQDIKCGRPRKGALGLASYVGSPYTTSFGEASDPEKGYQILMSDGLLEFVPTNLRKHVIIEVDLNHRNNAIAYSVGDILLVRVRGTAEQLLHFKKEDLGISEPYRLDLIPLETSTTAEVAKDLTQDQILDSLIDSLTNTSDERKANLKELWRKAVSG